MVELGFKLVRPEARLPQKAHESDAGMDVFAAEDAELHALVPTLVKTGLVPSIPDGYEMQVRPRSGLALKRAITVYNTPGTIDAGYKGEIGVILVLSSQCPSDVSVIKAGDRIAQLVLAPVIPCQVKEVEDVGESDRSKVGHGGFGSTGI